MEPFTATLKMTATYNPEKHMMVMVFEKGSLNVPNEPDTTITATCEVPLTAFEKYINDLTDIDEQIYSYITSYTESE